MVKRETSIVRMTLTLGAARLTIQYICSLILME